MVKALREAVMKAYEKVKERTLAYFARDGVGEKLTDIITICESSLRFAI